VVLPAWAVKLEGEWGKRDFVHKLDACITFMAVETFISGDSTERKNLAPSGASCE